jgi:pyridoxine 5-phosphate synthase
MPATRHQRLYINVDHVATLREARKGDAPDPVAAALLCEDAGADGITAHLREDRRHIQDRDVVRLMDEVRTAFNLELACTHEMVRIAEGLRPFQVTIVPEKREEITTEGGLDLSRDTSAVREAIARLSGAGIRVSLFIDPDADAVSKSRELGADAIELHTGAYANSGGIAGAGELAAAAAFGVRLGLAVHAGHGLTLANVGAVAAIPEIEELNIGHSIIGRSIFVGLGEAVREMRLAMDVARATPGASHSVDPRRGGV